jgi:esterase/lipase
MKRIKRTGIGVGAIVSVFLLGPRVSVNTTLVPKSLPENLDSYLDESESAYVDVIDGCEKQILWYGEPEAQAEFSVIYMHGFPSSRQDTAPLAELIGKELSANVFATRLTGHCRTDLDAMEEATVNAWLHDADEALQIGSRIGRKTIVLTFSTSGTIASWLLSTRDYQGVYALAMMSPNFGLADPKAAVLGFPWGVHLAEGILAFMPKKVAANEQQERYWTLDYPASANGAMYALVELAQDADFTSLRTPTCVLYSPDDSVIDPRAVEETFQRIGARQKKLIQITNSGAKTQHVLAGDILSPHFTDDVLAQIASFVTSIETSK